MKLIRAEDYKGEPLRNGELTPEELKEVYALGRAAFTAADLARYAEVEEGIPADEVLAELEEAQRQHDLRKG